MKQVRMNVFETNSSSTHSIAIPKFRDKKKLDDMLLERLQWNDHIRINEYGWEFQSVNPIEYLYTALCYIDDQKHINELKQFLSQYDENVSFDTPRYKKGVANTRYLDFGYIDHVEDLEIDLIPDLFKHKLKLLNFLAGAHIMTGTDNCDEDEEAILYNFDKKYIKKGYTLFHKGNS